MTRLRPKVCSRVIFLAGTCELSSPIPTLPMSFSNLATGSLSRNKVYEYGNKLIGSEFSVAVNGYSLGGALSLLFGFFASTDNRFTRNGPVRIFTYGMPLMAGNSFADAFRHQEMMRKVQHARFYNSSDIGEVLLCESLFYEARYITETLTSIYPSRRWCSTARASQSKTHKERKSIRSCWN